MKWKAPEFIYKPKTPAWYIYSLVITAIVVIIAIFQGNPVFLIFIILAEIMLLYFGNKKPQEVEYEVTSTYLNSIKWTNPVYFKDMVHYSLYHYPDYDEYLVISFLTNGFLNQPQEVLIPAKDLDSIYKLIQGEVEEVEYKETLADVILHHLGL